MSQHSLFTRHLMATRSRRSSIVWADSVLSAAPGYLIVGRQVRRGSCNDVRTICILQAKSMRYE
jgi:hypothetical protein